MEGINCRMRVPEVARDPEQMLFLQVDEQKCIGCGDCQKVCPTDAIYGEMGLTHRIVHPEPCLHCGQCLNHCPTGAIYDNYSWIWEVADKLEDPNVYCIAMVAPAVRYAIGECFGQKPGSNLSEQLLTALKTLGFRHCWDVEFGADVTIWEEGTEFIERLHNGGPFPQFSSCCPSWQKYAEYFAPDLIPHFSSVKSPVGINGRVAKTYGADRLGYDKHKVYTVLIAPCIGKKYESMQPQLAQDGIKDIDAVLTTRELAWLLKENNIVLPNLPAGTPDALMGESPSGTLFGTSGGVVADMSRYVWHKLMGAKAEGQIPKPVRITQGFMEYELKLPQQTVRMASIFGGMYFKEVCDSVRNGTNPWHFVEFMACPWGCINGGGQPLLPEMARRVRLYS